MLLLGCEPGERADLLLGRPDELERDLAVARDLHAARVLHLDVVPEFRRPVGLEQEDEQRVRVDGLFPRDLAGVPDFALDARGAAAGLAIEQIHGLLERLIP